MKRLFSLSVFLSFLSCSNDDNPSSEEAILGVWEISNETDAAEYPEIEDGEYEYVLQYEFMSNGNFESHSFLRNPGDETILGYRSEQK